MSESDRSRSSSTLTVVGTLRNHMPRLHPGEPSEEAREAVEELFPSRDVMAGFVARFAWLTVLSSLIAGFGLLSDSSAVVIGAMLVAPLMAPILAVSAALVRAENRRLVWGLAVVAAGTVLAVGVGWFVSAIAGQSLGAVVQLPTEVASRTSPDLLDLGVAVSAGAAGGYVLPRRDALSALPGVGIAVALVPPLASAGIAFQLGLGDEAAGALLLYFTNLAAIVFAASVVLIFSGFRPVERAATSLSVRLTLTLAVVAVVAVPLTIHTTSVLEDNDLRSTVADAIPRWDDTVQVTSIDVDAVDGVAQVQLLVVGPNDPLPAWRLAEVISEEFGGPVELVLRYDQIDQAEVSTR